LKKLQEYHWPGNVRELESVIKQSLLKARGSVLLPEFLPSLAVNDNVHSTFVRGDSGLSPDFVAALLKNGSNNLYAEVINNTERQLLTQVLEFTSGNQLKASNILGISRVTLRSKLKILGIQASDFG
jgi:two-component system nitrogen regulation response regulator GlnG